MDAKQTAIDTLVEITEDESLDPGHRIAAACAILDRLDRIDQKEPVAA